MKRTANDRLGHSSPVGQDMPGEVRLADGLPAGWAEAPIEDFATTATGGTPSRKREDYYGGDIPWVKSGDLTDGLVTEVDEKITQLGLDESNAKMFAKGAVCIALYGATVGKLGIIQMDASTNQAVCGIFAEDDISPDFVFHSLRNERANLIAKAQGGAQPNISNGIIKETVLRVAPKAEQVRIVSAIESLQERSSRAKQALSEARPLLSQLRQSVLRGAFSGRLTERWRTENPDAVPAKELLARIRTERRERWEAAQLANYEAKDKKPTKNWQDKYKEPEPVDESELEELPDGWCWASLDELAEKVQDGNYGGSYPKKDEWEESGVPFLTPAAINTSGAIVPQKVKYVSEEKNATLTKAQLQPGDVIFPNRGSRDAQRMGKQPFAMEVPDQWSHSNINPQLTLVRSVSSVSSTYLAMAMNSDSFLAQVRQATGGSALAFFNLATTKGMYIPIAPQLEQERICELVGETLKGMENVHAGLAASEAELTQLDQSILAKAFRGELVPQDPRDEPASVLLERIRLARESGTAKSGRRRKANDG